MILVVVLLYCMSFVETNYLLLITGIYDHNCTFGCNVRMCPDFSSCVPHTNNQEFTLVMLAFCRKSYKSQVAKVTTVPNFNL